MVCEYWVQQQEQKNEQCVKLLNKYREKYLNVEKKYLINK